MFQIPSLRVIILISTMIVIFIMNLYLPDQLSSFVVEKNGTVGVGTTSTVTLKYNSENPLSLFYAIEKSGFISTTDPDVKNGSKITYVDSDYDGKYTAFGVGTTSFNVSLKSVPEKLSYVTSDR